MSRPISTAKPCPDCGRLIRAKSNRCAACAGEERRRQAAANSPAPEFEGSPQHFLRWLGVPNPSPLQFVTHQHLWRVLDRHILSAYWTARLARTSSQTSEARKTA